MALILPRTSTVAANTDPRILVLLSNTKIGKSSNLLKLPNSLLIDLEDGSEYYDGTKLNLRKEAATSGTGLGSLLEETAKLIKAENGKAGKPIYDYIALDTLTAIEALALAKATFEYKKSPIGKNFTGKDVTELPKGAGYGLLRRAFIDIVEPFKGLAGKALILSGHIKVTSDEKTELDVKDIQLTGSLKLYTVANADAIGYMYRSKKNKNQNIISFLTDESNIATGARSEHLRNSEFVISELDPTTKELTVHWDKIFTSLGSNPLPVVPATKKIPV
jgi:hypothetical protein